MKASMRDGVDLPIDYEHQSDLQAGLGPDATVGPVPAAGWILELVAKPDGIWGKVRWTKTATDMMSEQAYRYVSPVVQHLKDGRILRILGAGLVHRPNLTLTALSSRQDDTGLAEIAHALDLDADADPGAVLRAINELRDGGTSALPDPSKYVAVEVVQGLVAEHAEAKRHAAHAQVSARIDRATEDGFLTPAMRGWAVALCSSDPDAFDAYLAALPAPFARLATPASMHRCGAKTGAPVIDPSVQAMADQLGVSPEDLV